MDRAQNTDEKNRIICLVIMFTPRVIVLKMSEIANFSNFLLITVKYLSRYGNIFKNMEDLIEFFQKMIKLINFGLKFF